MGPKRGRLLIRQQRVKRDSDSLAITALGQQSPSDNEFDIQQIGQRLLSFPSHTITQRHETFAATASSASNLTAQHPGHHLHHHPIHIQAQPSTSTTTHLLTVPNTTASSTPYLIKQHSQPHMLSSQSSLDLPGGTSHHYLQRQLSYPITSSDNMNLLTPLTLPSASSIISTPQTSATSSSSNVNPPVAHFIERGVVKMEEDDRSSHSSSQQSTPPTLHMLAPQLLTTPSPSIVVMSDTTPVTVHQPTTVSRSTSSPVASDMLLPSIRIKGEELQRSISSPLPTRELSTESRSQHCPVIRAGPALGCNFCWNTIDDHGRILRRKTKYHCPECQTNLCIVPCFQEYHERQNNESGDNPTAGGGVGGGGSKAPPLRQTPKSGSTL